MSVRSTVALLALFALGAALVLSLRTSPDSEARNDESLPVTIAASIEPSEPEEAAELPGEKEEPILEEYEEEDFNESDFEVLESNAEPQSVNSDSPFNASSDRFIGIGGGAGGGHRRQSPWDRQPRESYAPIENVGFNETAADPLLTFAADVDTGAYSNLRRMLLKEGALRNKDAVRVEELLNYFRYDGVEPSGVAPIGASLEIASCPWKPEHRLLQVVLRSKSVAQGNRQPANLVFLVDVSGSMNQANKLPLLKSGFRMLVDELNGRDSVAIVVYAGSAGLVLPPTACSQKEVILRAIDELKAGGSTAGGAGIQLAYAEARAAFVPDGINRVILATDGDFNVGVSDRDELVKLVEDEAKSGIFLTSLGFGSGNLNDAMLEQIADKGNGHYAYIDDELEAKKVLVTELGATLEVVAKDVKLQIRFDPEQVLSHRLIGYSNRRLAHTDLADDTKDGGEMGAGHAMTALFELVPTDVTNPGRVAAPRSDRPIATLDVRYKEPAGDESRLLTFTETDEGSVWGTSSEDFRFASAVAWFGETLRRERENGELFPWVTIAEAAKEGLGDDRDGYRQGFLELVRAAEKMSDAR